jgi:hypothetical protein
VAHLRVSILCEDSIEVGRALTRALAATVQVCPLNLNGKLGDDAQRIDEGRFPNRVGQIGS